MLIEDSQQNCAGSVFVSLNAAKNLMIARKDETLRYAQGDKKTVSLGAFSVRSLSDDFRRQLLRLGQVDSSIRVGLR